MVRSSAGPHAAHTREGAPAALVAEAGGASDARAASPVASDATKFSTGGVGLTEVGVILPLASIQATLKPLHITVAAMWAVAASECLVALALCLRCFQPSHSLQERSHHTPCGPAVRWCLAWPFCFNPLSKGNKALNSVREKGSIISENDCVARLRGRIPGFCRVIRKRSRSFVILSTPFFSKPNRFFKTNRCVARRRGRIPGFPRVLSKITRFFVVVSVNCFFLRLWGETVESAGPVFARSFRTALCPVSWLGVVRALGALQSCSFLVSSAGCEGAGRAGRCAALEARP